MKKLILISLIISIISCTEEKKPYDTVIKDVSLDYKSFTPKGNETIISRSEYTNKLKGFWLAQCIANWTGLVTEMDKIGNIGKVKTGPFYTREDWGKEDIGAYWDFDGDRVDNDDDKCPKKPGLKEFDGCCPETNGNETSDDCHIKYTIDFVFEGKDGLWGADDDTDIEYIYQHLLYTNKTSLLTGNQISKLKKIIICGFQIKEH